MWALVSQHPTPRDRRILIARPPLSSGRSTIPEIYQNCADPLMKGRIVRPLNCDSLRRPVVKSSVERAESGQIPIAPITRVRKKRAGKPKG